MNANTAPTAPGVVTPVRAAHLPLRSTGFETGAGWVLDQSGFVGTYLRVTEPGPVTVTVRARGFREKDSRPLLLNVALNGEHRRFELTRASSDHAEAITLPRGTYLLRVDFAATPSGGDEAIVEQVTVGGAELLEGNLDAHALAAADTGIEQHRRGRFDVRVPGLAAGTRVRARLLRNAFAFGTNVPYGENKLLPDVVAEGSDAALFQRLVRENFNTVVLSNGGKWVYNEAKRDRVDTTYLDRFFAFAEQNQLYARMHTLIWDNAQEPRWVLSNDTKEPGLLDKALLGDDRAKGELLEEIRERIGYYVRDRAQHYQELDLLNESVHRPAYVRALGIDGVARLYAETSEAVEQAGARSGLCLNEYNVLQWSRDPAGGAPDPYANWYRRHADALVAAGGHLDCLGIQYYADARGSEILGSNAHSPARIMQVLANLAGTGRRLSLTEFSVRPGLGGPDGAASVLADTLRLVYGTAEADAFMVWAIWEKAAIPVPVSTLFDASGAPTVVGRRYRDLLRSWSTDVEVQSTANGISFEGTHGDYELTLPDGVARFSTRKGQREYDAIRAPAVANPG